MKKFILLLTTVLTLAFAASCFATENSSALNDAEGSAQKVITALVASDTLGYKRWLPATLWATRMLKKPCRQTLPNK